MTTSHEMIEQVTTHRPIVIGRGGYTLGEYQHQHIAQVLFRHTCPKMPIYRAETTA